MIQRIKLLLLCSIILVSTSNAMKNLNSINENLFGQNNNTNLQINNIVTLNKLNTDTDNINKSFTTKKRNRTKVNKKNKTVITHAPICFAINNKRKYLEKEIQKKLNSNTFQLLGETHCNIMQSSDNDNIFVQYKEYYNNVINFFIKMNQYFKNDYDNNTNNINVFDNTIKEIYEKLYGKNSDNIIAMKKKFSINVELEKFNIFEIIAKLTIILSDWSKYMNSLRILLSKHSIDYNTFIKGQKTALKQLKNIKDIFSIQEIDDINK